jgi:hypothetical protein
MRGIMTFPSLAAAVQAGYQPYDRTESGYLVRTKTQHGWALALVIQRADGLPGSELPG